MTTSAMILIIAAVVVVVIAAFVFVRQQRTKKLRNHFGPEYDHAVREYGSHSKAEEELLARQKRLEKLPIHSLPPAESDQFAVQWHEVQSRFVDDPSGSIEKADQLVNEVMRARLSNVGFRPQGRGSLC